MNVDVFLNVTLSLVCRITVPTEGKGKRSFLVAASAFPGEDMNIETQDTVADESTHEILKYFKLNFSFFDQHRKTQFSCRSYGNGALFIFFSYDLQESNNRIKQSVTIRCFHRSIP